MKGQSSATAIPSTMRAKLLYVMLLLAAHSAVAEERLLIEETFLPVEIKGQPYKLAALVMKEAGVGRLPVAVITHGQAREAEDRERVAARNYLRTAREFARRGWLAVAVVRRGFGRSEGKQFYALRGCRNGEFTPVLDDQADDIEAAVKALGRRSDADISQVIALGVSVGGATVLNLGGPQSAGAARRDQRVRRHTAHGPRGRTAAPVQP